jgi:hypothetical protein
MHNQKTNYKANRERNLMMDINLRDINLRGISLKEISLGDIKIRDIITRRRIKKIDLLI